MDLLVPNLLTKNLNRKFVSYFIKFSHDMVIFISRINENAQNEKNENWTHHGSCRPVRTNTIGERITGVCSFFLVPA